VQNTRINPIIISAADAQNIAIIECAKGYGLAAEKEAREEFKDIAQWQFSSNRLEQIIKEAPEKKKLTYLKDKARKGTFITKFSAERFQIEIQKENRKFVSRASIAISGGLAIVTPMLIMALHPTRLTQLLTASLFVVSVTLLLA
jgi:hypothetical protein